MTEAGGVMAAIVRRDARVFYSYRLRSVGQLIGATFTLTLFYEISRLVSTRRFATPQAYFDFAAVGLAVLPVLRAGLVSAPSALRDELIAGTFEHSALSPFGPVAYLLCTLVFPFVVGMASGAITLSLAAVLFHLHVAWATAALAVPLALLGALALAPFATLLLAGTVIVKQLTTGAGWIVAAFSLLGGAYFPVALLPGWIRWASGAQPLTPALDLLRHVLVHASAGGSAPGQLARLAVFAAVGLPLGAAALHWACAFTRRRGTLLEY